MIKLAPLELKWYVLPPYRDTLITGHSALSLRVIPFSPNKLPSSMHSTFIFIIIPCTFAFIHPSSQPSAPKGAFTYYGPISVKFFKKSYPHFAHLQTLGKKLSALHETGSPFLRYVLILFHNAWNASFFVTNDIIPPVLFTHIKYRITGIQTVTQQDHRQPWKIFFHSL